MPMINDDGRLYFKLPPYEHQLRAHKLARDRDAYAFLCEMGTGKSAMLTSVMAYQRLRGRINAAVIFAPNSVCQTWVEEQLPKLYPDLGEGLLVYKWSTSNSQKNIKEQSQLLMFSLRLKVLVMNIEAMSTKKGFTFAEKFVRSHHTLVAVDESTRIKSVNAKRTTNVIKVGNLAVSRYILTGMPITQSPLDIYSQYEFLDPDFLERTNFFSFKCRYGVLRRRYVNNKQFDEVVGYQRLDELQKIVLRNGIRVLKSECLQLPPKVYSPDREVELGEEQRRHYEGMRDNAVMMLSEEEIVTAPLVMTQLLRLRQVLSGIMPRPGIGLEPYLLNSNPRMDELVELLDEIEGKVIIWASFVPVVKEIIHRLGQQAVGLYGDMKPDARQLAINEFQNNPGVRFFVGQVHTGGIGINLTAAEHVVYYDNDWSLEARAQSEDRAHRIGQTKTVTYTNLVAPKTVDDVILKALKAKKSLADQVTGDGWRSIFTGEVA